MSMRPWDLASYRIRRKFLKLFGASFRVYDGDQVVAFCKQQAFRLREDIRLFADESRSHELLAIKARSAIDFAAAYDVVDSQTRETVGTLRRRGFASLVRDNWEVLDHAGRSLGTVSRGQHRDGPAAPLPQQPDSADASSCAGRAAERRRSPSASTR